MHDQWGGRRRRRSPVGRFIRRLLLAVVAGGLTGYLAPGAAVALKPLSEGFIALIRMMIAPLIFCTVSLGIANAGGLKKAGRTALKALVYFETLSTLALLLGRWLIAQFVDAADPHFAEIVQVGVDYLMVIALFYTLFSVFFAFNGFFRGVGDAVIVMALTIISLTIRAVSAYLLVGFAGMGPEAVAWSIPIGWGLCSAFAWFYHKKRWWAGKVAVRRVSQVEAE